VAWLATKGLLSVAPPIPRLDQVVVSSRVLAFAITTGVLTGLIFGLAPTMSLVVAPTSLRARGSSVSKTARSLQTLVASLQLSFTVMLLVAAALFGRSLIRLMSVDPGFTAEGVVSFAFDLPAARATNDAATAQFQAELVRVANEVPGVSAVSMTTELPFPGGKGGRSFALGPDAPMSSIAMWQRSVLANYHELMGIPLLAGRYLSSTDALGAAHVIVVSRSFAEQVWPGESAIGKQIYKTGPGGSWTVVGIVGDVRHKTLGAPPEPTIYRTMTQAPARRVYLVARTRSEPAATLAALQQAVWRYDANTPITEAGVMASFTRDSEADDRFRATLVQTFAGFAALLAGVGIFGVTARSVSSRRRELGIRAALGARPRWLVTDVLRDGLRATTIGILLGLIAALWGSRFIAHLLYQLPATDPPTYAAVALVVFTLALVASYLPARRVTRIPPSEVMSDG
jgi:predicted permease